MLDLTPGGVPIVSILALGGGIAASARVAVVGDYAIYDRIETHQDHRRRGLASAAIKTLETIARARHATRGVLVATADGRALYEAMGWPVHTLYTSAVIPGPPG